MVKKIFLLVLLTGLIFLGGAASARSLYWDKIAVDLTLNRDSSVDIVETQTYIFDGAYNGGYRDIKFKGFDSISNIELYEGDIKYQAGSLDKYHYTVGNENGARRIKWRSRDVDEPEYSQTSKTFTIKYRVNGLIDHQKGFDELYWKAIFEDREGNVNKAEAVLHLPSPVEPEKLKVILYTNVSGATWQVTDPQTIVFRGENLPPGELFEVKVDFPPGLVAHVFSLKKTIKTFVSPYLPWVIAGAIFIFMLSLYLRLGRDYEVAGVATVITSPPTDLAPALAGTVIDEEAGMKELIATILDLSRRGFIGITEKVSKVWLFTTRDFEYQLKAMPVGLSDYEDKLIQGLFGVPKVGEVVKLSDLQNKFYKHVDGIVDLIFKQTVKLGYFEGNPRDVKMKYYLIAVGVFILGLVASFFGDFEVAIVNGMIAMFFFLPSFFLVQAVKERRLVQLVFMLPFFIAAGIM
ncbi:MAG: DUF2207 domain-containing protein, partial [Candidatus Margulisbacteria bacterium]|nr:DUF2207 domain-containing protein [Candidatus Margulisiibacteriota bacterium]